MKQAIEKLEDFLIQINRLRISRFAQFYTEDRYYRIKGSDGIKREGMFNANEMMLEWVREEVKDEAGNITGVKKERFIPEFDITVSIINEKPTDRGYYTSAAFDLFDRGLMTAEDLWYTLEEGKFPLKDDVLQHIKAADMAKQLAADIGQLPPEMQQQIQGMTQQMIQDMMNPPQQQIPQGMPQDMQGMQDIPPELLQELMMQMQQANPNPEQEQDFFNAQNQLPEGI